MINYGIDLRKRVVGCVREGGGPAEAARLFRVSRMPLYRWLGAPDLRLKPTKECRRNLDKETLAAHVRDFPEALCGAGVDFSCGVELGRGRPGGHRRDSIAWLGHSDAAG